MQPFNPSNSFPQGPQTVQVGGPVPQTVNMPQGYPPPAQGAPWPGVNAPYPSPGSPVGGAPAFAPQGPAQGFPGFAPGAGFAPGRPLPPAAARFNAEALAGVEMNGTRYPYLENGIALCEIQITLISNKKSAFVAELKILQSDATTAKPGDMRAYVRSGEYKDKDIVSFLVCASGYDTLEAFTAASNAQGYSIVNLGRACSDAINQIDDRIGPNPLKGRIILTNTYPAVSKKDGKTYSRTSFQAYKG